MADFVLLYSGGSMPETEEEQAQVGSSGTRGSPRSAATSRTAPVHARG